VLRWLEVRARSLGRDGTELARVLDAILHLSDLDDASVEQRSSEAASLLEQRVMPDAQNLLRHLASSALGPVGAFDDVTRGLGHLAFLKRGPDAEVLAALVDEICIDARFALALVGATNDISELVGPLEDALSSLRNGILDAPLTPSTASPPFPHRARVAQLPVAFTGQAHAIPHLDHPDGPAISVLTQLMFSGYLNSEIRKGGAYGVDFEVLPERGLWWISSRRDPLPVATYAAFDEAFARFREGRWDGPNADEGRLAILRVTDPVDTPATAARRAWIGAYTGHDGQAWNRFRRRVLDVTDDDVQRVASTYFNKPARATLVGKGQLEDPAISAMFDEIKDV
jgi:Zn-dependent M16 (insulinase) family peptidase